jgi:hypothetical protein
MRLKDFKCDFCDYTCGGNGDLRKHLEALHDYKEWRCQKCNDFFMRKSLLNKHMVEKHVIKQMSKCASTKYVKE